MKKAKVKQRKPARKLRVVKKAKAPEEPKISKEMNEFYSAMKCIATAHNLLDTGLFKHTQAQAVHDSLVFFRSLHAQVKEKAFEHPECDLIPELKNMKEQERKNLEAQREASKGPVQKAPEEIDEPAQKAAGGPQDAA